MYRADWITWTNNPQTASHMSVVWKRQIRISRGILNPLVKADGINFDGKSLHMLLVEVEAIVNRKPMATETISDVKSDIQLSPVNVLTHGIESSISTSKMLSISWYLMLKA